MTQIGFVKELQSERWHFSLVLSYIDDTANYLGLLQAAPTHTVPYIVKRILSDKNLICSTRNGDCVPTSPCRLSVGEEKRFWEEISNPNRTLPYVLVNSSLYSPSMAPMLDVKKLADVLLGNAKVFYMKHPDFLSRFNSFYARGDFSVSHWMGLRVYMPKINVEDSYDAKRHRYIRETEMNEETIPMLRRAFASVPTIPEQKYDFFGIEDCLKMRGIAYRQTLIREHQSLQHQVRAKDEELKVADELLSEKAEDEILGDGNTERDMMAEFYEELEKENVLLSAENQDQASRLKAQERQIDSLSRKLNAGKWSPIDYFTDQELIEQLNHWDKVDFLRTHIIVPLINSDVFTQAAYRV